MNDFSHSTVRWSFPHFFPTQTSGSQCPTSLWLAFRCKSTAESWLYGVTFLCHATHLAIGCLVSLMSYSQQSSQSCTLLLCLWRETRSLGRTSSWLSWGLDATDIQPFDRCISAVSTHLTHHQQSRHVTALFIRLEKPAVSWDWRRQLDELFLFLETESTLGHYWAQ